MINDKCPGFSLIEVLVVLSLMALLVALLGSKINNMDPDWKFDKTCHMMEEIKEAIIGKPALYCNGIRQFTGYVSDMGTLPTLFYIDNDKELVRLDKDNDISEVLKECRCPPQPRTLWTTDINGDGEDEIPEEALWRYHEHASIWAGWRGPYIPPPPGGVLRDAWGNPFVFITGELVMDNEKTYRCIKTHEAGYHEPHRPEVASEYWKELSMTINSREWVHPGGEGDLRTDLFYADVLTIISYGKDREPGVKGLDRDLVLTIYKEEWTGEVAGHVGYCGGAGCTKYVDMVSLYCPEYTKGEDLIKDDKEIEIQDIDEGYGINFRFGIADSIACVKWECDGTDGTCICIEYDENGDCLKWNYEFFALVVETGFFGGMPETCEVTSEEPFACSQASSLNCYNVECTEPPSIMLYSGKQCLQYEQGECEKWECEKDLLLDYDCSCSGYGRVDDPNSMEKNIPIGIRSITTNTGKVYIFAVTEGGNWVGTVK